MPERRRRPTIAPAVPTSAAGGPFAALAALRR
jgi:hypothetical protein